jgi:hypothetical protein
MKVLELQVAKRVLWQVVDGPKEWIGTTVVLRGRVQRRCLCEGSAPIWTQLAGRFKHSAKSGRPPEHRLWRYHAAPVGSDCCRTKSRRTHRRCDLGSHPVSTDRRYIGHVGALLVPLQFAQRVSRTTGVLRMKKTSQFGWTI